MLIFDIFTETLEQNIRKSQKILFFRWKRRQIKQNQKFSNFWENHFYSKAIAFDKIGGNYALSANSIKIFLLGYFCMQNSYLRWKQFKILRFPWKMQKKKIEKWIILVISVNFLRFSLKLLSRISEKVRKYVFQMEKKSNKSKLDIFKFLRISTLSQGYSLW